MRCTVIISPPYSPRRVICLVKLSSTLMFEDPVRPLHGMAAHIARVARVQAVYIWWPTMA